MNCNDITTVQNYLSGDDPTTVTFGCMPSGIGTPTHTPQPDEVPFYFDKRAEELYYYTCEPEMWSKVDNTLGDLNPIDISGLSNPARDLKIGLTYTMSGTTIEGLVSVKEFFELVSGNHVKDIKYSAERNALVVTKENGDVANVILGNAVSTLSINDSGDIVVTKQDGSKSTLNTNLNFKIKELLVEGNKLVVKFDDGSQKSVNLPVQDGKGDPVNDFDIVGDQLVIRLKSGTVYAVNRSELVGWLGLVPTKDGTLTRPTIKGPVGLDASAVDSLCAALTPCIQALIGPSVDDNGITVIPGDTAKPDATVEVDIPKAQGHTIIVSQTIKSGDNCATINTDVKTITAKGGVNTVKFGNASNIDVSKVCEIIYVATDVDTGETRTVVIKGPHDGTVATYPAPTLVVTDSGNGSGNVTFTDTDPSSNGNAVTVTQTIKSGDNCATITTNTKNGTITNGKALINFIKPSAITASDICEIKYVAKNTVTGETVTKIIKGPHDGSVDEPEEPVVPLSGTLHSHQVDDNPGTRSGYTSENRGTTNLTFTASADSAPLLEGKILVLRRHISFDGKGVGQCVDTRVDSMNSVNEFATVKNGVAEFKNISVELPTQTAGQGNLNQYQDTVCGWIWVAKLSDDLYGEELARDTVHYQHTSKYPVGNLVVVADSSDTVSATLTFSDNGYDNHAAKLHQWFLYDSKYSIEGGFTGLGGEYHRYFTGTVVGNRVSWSDIPMYLGEPALSDAVNGNDSIERVIYVASVENGQPGKEWVVVSSADRE